jgi:F1F0 ATPase subunit 2
MPEGFFLIGWFAAGAALAAAYLFFISRTVASVTTPGSGRLGALHLLLRIALAVCVFTLAAQQGAMPLLATLAGFLAARHFVIRRFRDV